YLSNPNPREYWIYYTVADSGNRRIVELVDRYVVDPTTNVVQGAVVDGTGAPQLGVLTWHSPSTMSGKNFRYNNISTLYESVSSVQYVAGMGNATPTSSGLGIAGGSSTSKEAITGNGGIIIFSGSGP